MVGFALVLLVIGIGHVVVPRVSWFLSIGWKLKNASPSAAFMLAFRVGGAVLSVIGLIIIVSVTSQAAHHSYVATKNWRQFQRQMTVQNIQSIRAEGTQPLPGVGDRRQWPGRLWYCAGHQLARSDVSIYQQSIAKLGAGVVTARIAPYDALLGGHFFLRIIATLCT